MPQPQNSTPCRRCGACCTKGGPAFHRKDRPLIDTGIIPAKYLFTIREGEPVLENVRGKLVAAATDIIKIKGKAGGWECLFHTPDPSRCGIYDHRPEECRLLDCRKPDPLTAMYDKDRLTRRDLLADVPGIWDMVEDHQGRCGYDTIMILAGRIKGGDQPSRLKLREMIAYDRQLRLTLAENGVAMEMMDFLFGRALSITIPPLGIAV